MNMPVMPAFSCDRCEAVYHTAGGLLFSVPDAEMRVTKYHLCPDCTAHWQAEVDKPLRKARS